jgi:hypothetical protein
VRILMIFHTGRRRFGSRINIGDNVPWCPARTPESNRIPLPTKYDGPDARKELNLFCGRTHFAFLLPAVWKVLRKGCEEDGLFSCHLYLGEQGTMYVYQ